MKTTPPALLLLLLAGACVVPPTFNDTPEIELEDVSFVKGGIDDRGNPLDTLSYTIRFQDGDGNLGLDQRDTLPPFQRLLPGGGLNPNYNNFFARIYVWREGAYQLFGQDDGRFERILKEEDGGESPLEGTIRRKYQTFSGFSGLMPGDTVQVEVYIRDRDLQTSNTVRGPVGGYIIPE